MDIPDGVYAAAIAALHRRQCDCPEGPGHDPLADADAQAVVDAIAPVLLALALAPPPSGEIPLTLPQPPRSHYG